jgi:putative ABC transport system permease protein
MESHDDGLRDVVRRELALITGDPARDEEIVDELAQHLALRLDELRRAGTPEDDALAIVRAELRGAPSSHEALVDAIRGADRERPIAPVPPSSGRGQLVRDLWRDVRYAIRLLRRHPTFTVAALLTLSLGIGLTAAIFSVVQAVLLQPVPFPDADRLLMVWQTDRNADTVREPASVPDFIDIADRSRQFDRFGAFASYDANLTPPAGDPVRVSALMATPGLFTLLGVRPVAGRLYSEAEDRVGGPPVALISEDLWARLFNRDPVAIGRSLRLNGRDLTIVGVVPQSADFGVLQILSAAAYGRGFADRDARTRVAVWTPLQSDESNASRDSHGLMTVGRLAPGANADTAQQELSRIAADLERAYPVNDGRGAFVEPLQHVIFGRVQMPLAVLMGAVLLVLLISCVNVANLLLARGTGRVREVAVRTALGAETARLLRQFVVENTVLTVAAGGLGVLVAYGMLRLLVALGPANIPRLASTSIDGTVLALTLGFSTVVGMIFGLFPLAHVPRRSPQSVLRAEDTRGASARTDGWLRSTLVVVEIAMAVVLVTGAGLLIRSFWQIQQTNPGFDVAGVLKAEFQISPVRYPVNAQASPFTAYSSFADRLQNAVAALPGVEVAALAAHHPLDTGFATSFSVSGREEESTDWPEISLRHVTPDYFRALRVPLIRGRLLRESDTATSAAVTLINEAVARRFFPDADPIGHTIRFWGRQWTIVGIVGDERFHGITKAAPIAAYVPLVQTRFTTMVLLVRTAGDTAAIAPGVLTTIRAVDPQLPVFGVEALDDTFANSIAERRFLMMLLGLLAVLAMLLAAVGVHGVLSYVVAQRTKEIGVRMTLGADASRVVWMVAAQGLVLTAVGLVVGVAVALASARWLSGLLFEVTPTDGTTLGGVVIVLGLVAAVSIWLPARRAVRIDPLVALRAD